MTEGFVHDVRTKLATVLLASQNAVEQHQKQHSVGTELAMIQEGAKQAADILLTLMNLHDDQNHKPAYHDLNAIVDETVQVLRRVLNRRLELELCLAPGQLVIEADGPALKKAIIYLAFSAAAASSQRGKILFTTANASPSGSPNNSELVSLTIADGGPARTMPSLEEILALPLEDERLKEPANQHLFLAAGILRQAGGTLQNGSGGNSVVMFLPQVALD